MAQIAEIVMAILGLNGVIPMKTLCIVILSCEGFRLFCDVILKTIKRNKEED